jgi:hypothetical protein
MMRRMAAVAVPVGMWLLAACYSYRPVDAVAPKPGKRIALTLTPAGVKMLTLQLGPQVTSVEGDLLEADSTAIRLALRRVENSQRLGTKWNGEQVTIPREVIEKVSERRLSIGATAIASGLAVGGVLGAYAAFGTSGQANGVAVPGPIPHQ